MIQRFSEEKEIAAISLVLMWFNKTFEKVVISEPVQVRFSCWLLGIGSTLSEVILICHSIRPGSSEVAFFDYRYGFNLPYSPKSLLHISLVKKQPGSPIFFYFTLIHIFSGQQCHLGSAMGWSTVDRGKQFCYNAMYEIKNCTLHCTRENHLNTTPTTLGQQQHAFEREMYYL